MRKALSFECKVLQLAFGWESEQLACVLTVGALAPVAFLAGKGRTELLEDLLELCDISR